MNLLLQLSTVDCSLLTAKPAMSKPEWFPMRRFRKHVYGSESRFANWRSIELSTALSASARRKPLVGRTAT